MQNNRKRIQIIKCYMDEILPNINYLNLTDDLKILGKLKSGTIISLNKSNLENYINYKCIDNLHIHLDFNNSSIKDVYKGLVIISKRIKD